MIYFVTGKLGSGKTLASVGRIRTYLRKGLPVATNLDLKLENLLGSNNKTAKVYRLPDHPIASDMALIGIGNESYDESKNGAIVLDECGTWFNTRSWGDKGRREMLDWMLHARKRGWDVYFIVQDFSMVDKQARSALGEHVVYCKRMDRFGIPIFSALFRMFGINLRPPQIHMGIVKYGESRMSPTVDRWTYRGHELYDAYDTKQVFVPREDKTPSVYSYLSPWLISGRYKAKRNMRFYMRLTKIYMKTFSRVLALSTGIALGAASAAYAYYSVDKSRVDGLVSQVASLSSQIKEIDAVDKTSLKSTSNDPYNWNNVVYSGSLGGHEPVYIFEYRSSETVFSFTSDDISYLGYQIEDRTGCGVVLLKSDTKVNILCHSSSAPPVPRPDDKAQQLSQGAVQAVTNVLPF